MQRSVLCSCLNTLKFMPPFNSSSLFIGFLSVIRDHVDLKDICSFFRDICCYYSNIWFRGLLVILVYNFLNPCERTWYFYNRDWLKIHGIIVVFGNKLACIKSRIKNLVFHTTFLLFHLLFFFFLSFHVVARCPRNATNDRQEM